MYVPISLQPDIGTFLKIEPGVVDGDQVDPLLIGQVNALGQFVAMDLKLDLGLQQQEVDAGAMEEDVERAMNLPLQLPGEDPAARVQQVGMGVWDPIPKSAENRRAWALNIMTDLGFQGVTNPAALVSPAPAHPAPVPPALAPPAAASRSSGMTLQQWAALEASSGGGLAKPTGAGPKPLQRKSLPKGTRTRATTSAPAGVAAQGVAATAGVGKPLSSRALKRLRPYIKWEPDHRQLQHSYLLLNGKAPYNVPTSPVCLPLSDPRMVKGAKWMCPQPNCGRFFGSQLDCLGHIQKDHHPNRSPPLCTCGSNTFVSAKALWDHLDLQHHIKVVEVKNGPKVVLKPTTRTPRT